MEEVIIYIITFLVIFLFYFLFVILRKKKLEKFKENMYVTYLVKMYKLDLNRIRVKDLVLSIALVNSFIVSTTVFILGFVNNLILKFILALVVLIPLQLLMYHIVGKIFQKRFKEDE